MLASGIALAAAAGCEEPRAFGEPCTSDDDCDKGLCVAGLKGEAPVCTRSCAATTDCPAGWACGAVTSNRVLVCTHGPATPFGQ